MFVCQITGAVSAPGDKCNKIVISRREKTYFTKVFNEDMNRYEDVEVGRGWEIVKEVNATVDGVTAWNELPEAEQLRFAKTAGWVK